MAEKLKPLRSVLEDYENKEEYPEHYTLPAEGPGSDKTIPDSPLIQRQREIITHYKALEGSSFNRGDFLPSIKADRAPAIDIANILVGGEMSALGMQLDSEGLDWSWDRFKQNWSEHPIANSITTAAWVLPGAAYAVNKYSRNAKYSTLGDDALKEYGLIDSLEEGATMDPKTKRIAQAHVYQMQRGKELEELVTAGAPLEGAPLAERLRYRKDQLEWAFRKSFANTAADHLNPNMAPQEGEQFVKRIQSYVEGDEFNKHLMNMPDPERGPAIARAIHDPSEMPNLSANEVSWASALRKDLVQFQKEGLDEGFIDEATSKKVGDVWLPMQREGTPIYEGGPLTTSYSLIGKTKEGKVQKYSIPRTASPHLIERETSAKDISNILREQEAVGLLKQGKKNKAIGVLKGDQFTEAKDLIQKGETDQAISILSKNKPIIATPESLTVGGLLQQKLLLESFRYVRDVATNSKFVRSKSQIQAMSKGAQKGWVDLDTIPNSGIVRRMTGKKLGKPGAVEELGFVRKDLFDSLTDIVGENTKAGWSLPGMIEGAVIMHKTAMTAGNPYTHGQNIIGNGVFMWSAGWNPLEGKNFATVKSAAKAYGQWSKAEKEGRLVSQLDLGTLATDSGKTLNIAEEIADPIVRGIILETNLMEAEGLGALDRLLAKTDDSQLFLKSVLSGAKKVTQKTGLAKMAKAYMAEDDVSKLAYYLGMRQKGMSRRLAALEVSRRLPMYSHVGRTVKASRRWIYPWISFPMEAMRITKNNLMDNPMRTIMLFHAHKGLQAMAYPFMDESAPGIESRKQDLPMWGQRPGRTIMTPFKDSNDNLRSMALDWLPHTAMLPATEAAEAPLLQKLPMGLGEPFSIVQALHLALTGKDSWGNEVPMDPMNPVQDLAKTIGLSVANFVTPPMISKYFMNAKAPYPWYRLGQDAGINIDPTTGKPGDPLFDMFVNNFNSFGKMYPSSGEQGLSNRAVYDDSIDKYQAKLTKEWSTLTRNGSLERAAEKLEDIQRLFIEKHKDPNVANQKFSGWLKRHLNTLAQHPKLKGYTREQLLESISQNIDPAGEARTKAQGDRISVIRRELAIRGHKKGKSGSSTGAVEGVSGVGAVGGI